MFLIRWQDPKKHDIVYGDAFIASVPYHLITLELDTMVRDRQTDDYAPEDQIIALLFAER